MNREEAIEMWIIPALKNTWNEKKCNEVLEALEQEPCDAISRQAVLEAIEDDNRNGHYSCFASNNDAQCFKQIIRDIPPVMPVEKQVSCDDCISRQAVLEVIRDFEYKNSHEEMLINSRIKQLPSVTPAEKAGRWIEHSDGIGEWWECSQCGAHGGEGMKYCMFCGAKMSEIPTSCSTCILDRTDACTRGAGRAVDDEACEDYLASPTGAEGSDKE